MILLAAAIFGKTMTYMLLIVLAIAVYITILALTKVRQAQLEFGAIRETSRTNFAGVLFIMLAVAAVVIYLIKMGLENNMGMLNYILFSVFPYMTLVVFLIGTVYRYRARGFQVSSLSSQFLERKKLFWGSQPFHWGLLVLFFGHLIAFLFPASVLAWNGDPVRLMILEVSSFAFGLSAILGLALLIRRRLGSDKVQVVTNKMDMLVYTTLIVQIISGLGVAYFERWGSSWFAAVLTPYLRSVFAFNPDIAAVTAMPWIIQVHIVSAFFIIAIIPFTRFMHFLVAPIDYIWRGYQLVIWNWGRKSIRNSTTYQYGKRSRNN
jgi:nitrate reductase gamma subunit